MIPLYTYPNCEDQKQNFFNHYVNECVGFLPDQPRTKFPDQQSRVCRFCNKGYQETTFKQDSHAIPEALGNKYLVTDDECDECNKLFAGYETCLMDYLGLYRTAFNSKGKTNKVPKFKSPGGGLTASNTPFQNIEDAITISDNSGDGFQIDKDTGNTIISYTKNSYIPLYAYKALLKMALSLIDKKHISDYAEAFRCLITGTKDEHFSCFGRIGEAHISRQMHTHYMIFKKRNPEDIPTHIFMLYYRNLIFQLFIPLHQEDIKMYNSNLTRNILFCPPLLFQPVTADETAHFQIKDLSGREKIKESGFLQMTMDNEALKHMAAVNPLTGEEVTDFLFKSKDIAKIMIVPAGSSLNFGKQKKDTEEN